ncbi:GGDEF domain-containing response regulator [Fortiea contorta]|uniref:GGDEF domain-containing response regulator n=1 Tax=Fortiea contorta TaxID=1892405 RepID=UPI000345863D|nr:diguanylate cyclase [Fortiea contorta]
MFTHKILVVENEQVLAFKIRNSLQKLGYHVPEITNSGEEALRKIADTNPHLVLIDICLAGEINGIHVVDIIQEHFQIPVLYLTEYSEDIRLHKKRLSEPFSYVLKPCAEKDLKFAVEMALYKHKIYQRCQEEKQRLASTIQSMGCAVVVTFANGCVQMMNPIAEALTGWLQNEAYGKDLSEIVNLVDRDLDEVMGNLATKAIKTGRVLHLPDNCTLITKDGMKIPVGDCVAPIRDVDGNINGAVLVLQDITQRKQAEAKLMRHACYDTLTGLPNRVLFLDRLNQAIERSKRRHDYRYAVLFLDLDGFKGINDRFGHGIGDDFLVAIARRLELSLRSGDTVARFGGDEFALLIEDIKDVTDATNVANRIQETLGLPLNLDGNQIIPTASIGIALSKRDYEEPHNLLRDADIAMYRAKRAGKARYGIFS